VKLARWLILLASVVLFCGALLHLVGYRFVVPLIANTRIDPKVLGAVKCVWLVFSVEMLILSPAFVWISRRPAGRDLLLYLALIPLIDGILMYYFVGPFIGSNIVAVGTVLLLVGAWLLPRGNTSAA
jgi:hypothetical protein